MIYVSAQSVDMLFFYIVFVTVLVVTVVQVVEVGVAVV